MKKVLFVTALLVGAIALQAQVYLADVAKPLSQHRLTISSSKADSAYNYNGPNPKVIILSHSYVTNGGIMLGGAAQGLVGGDDHGYATFPLNKKYEKMSFWLGTSQFRGGKDRKSILTVQADGKRLYDKPVFNSDEPRFIVLDVSGKDSVTFKVQLGEMNIGLAQLQVWKAGETVVEPKLPYKVPNGKVKLVEQLVPYYSTGTATCIHKPFTKKYSTEQPEFPSIEESISIGRHMFYNGLQLANYEGLCDASAGDAYFWLRKKYDKLSFIVGPRDNKSSNASAWLIIYGDKNKILYEEIVRQTDLPRQVVLDVAGQERVRFSCEFRGSEFLGGITFGAVDIYAYPKSDLASVPKEGEVNLNKDVISKLPSPCALMSNIKPYSVHGFADADAVRFTGESSYITFSMGGEKFSEGLILTTGKKLLGDQVEAYMNFDLAGEFDYISFYAGMLTNHRVLDDDRMLVFADDKLILDTMIYCTWPNQYFELPINKCRMLKFAKRGNGSNKQCYIGVGDIALYRGKPVKNDLFYHEKPECPYEADLIDLCTRPYFHFVGRYLSTLTSFDFNDCFQNGETKRRFFQMKDGSQIYKGVMLEANMPLSFEDVTVSDALLMFFVGAGGAISSSNMSAYTGVTAGGGLAGQMAILHLMNNQNGGQASVVAFNPFGEYESCTFTVANKSEYWDDVDKLKNFGERVDHPFKLNVFADQVLVKELWLTNKMEPQTFTVPIFKCHSLMFWLEPGETRSGQFVLYDMTVSKKPCNIPIPTKISTNSSAAVVEPAKAQEPTKVEESTKVEEPAKQEEPVPTEKPAPAPVVEEITTSVQPSEQQSQPVQTNVQQTNNQPAARQITIPKGNTLAPKSGNSLAPKK